MNGPDDYNGADAPSFLPPWAMPLSATVRVSFGARSRGGAGRTVNEDHFLIIRLGRHQQTLMTSLSDDFIATRFDEYGYAMVVADGMGGTGAGEAASHLALVTLVHLVRQFGKWNLRVDDRIAQEIMERAELFYRQVDGAVAYERTLAPSRVAQTTLTATFGAGRDLFFAHVGHSRAYLCRGGRLMRLTRDHTTRHAGSRRMPRAPLIEVSRLANDLQHILTDTVGMIGAAPTIDLERLQLNNDDRVLVCTNGLTDMVDEAAIGEILASNLGADEQCKTLVDRAMAAGGEDDTTALVAQYRIRS